MIFMMFVVYLSPKSFSTATANRVNQPVQALEPGWNPFLNRLSHTGEGDGEGEKSKSDPIHVCAEQKKQSSRSFEPSLMPVFVLSSLPILSIFLLIPHTSTSITMILFTHK